MRVGIDIDETITAVPSLFSIMTKSLRAKGHMVYIITFRDKELRAQTEEELESMGIEYDMLIMGEHLVDPPWKARQCVKYKIDMLFEDSESVISAALKMNPGMKAFHVREM